MHVFNDESSSIALLIETLLTGGIVGVDLIANVCLICAVNKDYSGR